MWVVLSELLSKSITTDFNYGPIINDNGLRFITEASVGSINSAKVEIFSREHPPPHFKVTLSDSSAIYSIKDCTKLAGELGKFEKNVIFWHRENKSKLIDEWNRLRPTDCPVGKYVEQD